MARGKVGRGEIWLHSFRSPDKRRPVLILSYPLLLTAVRDVIIAPITSTSHGTATEVMLGIDNGLKHTSFVNLAYITTVRQEELHHFVGAVGGAKMEEVCRALNIACGCV